MSDFYVTLLSNSSTGYFPTNKTSMFTTQLPKTIHLTGDEWEVALAELQVPCSLTTLNEGENLIYIKQQTKNEDKLNQTVKSVSHTEFEVTKTRIEAGNYTNIDGIITALNTNTRLVNRVKFTLNKTSRKIHVGIQDSGIVNLTLSPKLNLQLGFEPDVNLCVARESRHPANVLLGLPAQLFVYCDIIEPQVIGDVHAKVLRIAVIDSRRYMYGSYQTQMFSPAHYVPVLKREFENIEIDIRTSTGSRVPFLFGTACVKLHFRRKQLP